MCDFLTNRRQRVLIKNCMSQWLICTSVIPQSSVLGPILFLILLMICLNCIQYSSLLLYADNAKIFKRIDCMLDCELFQRDLDCMTIWCDLWQLKLNISKCMFVRFGIVDKPTYECSLPGTLLQKVVPTKDLGIIFNSKI